MTIKVTCPTCSKIYQLPATLAGKSSKCVSCGEVLRVPAAEGAKSPQPQLQPQPAKLTNSPAASTARQPGESATGASMGPWVNLRRVRAGVAGIFGGVLGLHKLFLRQYITAGILCLATIFFLILSVEAKTWQIAYYGIGFIEFMGIVEGLTLLVMNDEAFVYCYGPRVARR